VAKHIKRIQEKPTGKIQPGVPAGASTDGETPVFCLRHLAEGWRVSDCERDDQAAFAVTLEKLSRLTWQEIRGAHRHGMGTEKIARTSFRVPVPSGITEDVQFLAVRFNGLKAMVGFRSGVTFHIVWLDRTFEVYRH
jgi:hypothetical protein